MNTKMKMRMLSLLLCFVMLVGLMPTTAFAWSAPTLYDGKAEWNVQLSDEGVLTWNDMGSTTYDIYVDKTATGPTVTKIQGISGTSYNLINRFKELKIENGTYYFQIKANDTDTVSGVISFRYVSPEAKLSEPQNLRWDGTVAKWDSVAGATGYTVNLYSVSGYLHSSKTTTETQYDWTTIATYGRWFEVVATGDNYRNSNAAESPLYGSSVATSYHVGADVYNITTNEQYTGGKVKIVTPDDTGDYAYVGYGYDVDANAEVTMYAQADTGYEFVEWRTGSESGTQYSTNATVTFNATEDKVLYAIFQQTVSLTQISELSATVTAPVGGEHPSFTVTVPDGAHYTATVYAWYDLDAGTEMTGSDTFVAGTQYQVRIHFTANTGYEIESASYTINDIPNYASFDTAEQRGMNFVATAPAVTTYTVTYDANGGTGTMADATGISGEYTLLANGFTAPDGKQFKAWSVNSSEKAVGDTITVNANTTVTAIWEAIEYNVTVTGGTASVGAGAPITKATMGTTVTLTAGAAPSGQMFDKWVVNGVVVADANSATTTFTMPANNVTAQATYKDIPVVTYTVTFDANGGTGSMADATGVSGDYVLPVCGFTAPNGKQFKAWSVGGVEKAEGATITVSANTTVTAVWENIPVTYYTVTFDSNGGSAVTAQTIEAGQKATKPADPTKAGYDFKGWTLNGSAYDFNSAVNGDITLVATWEQQQVVPTTYTVSFAANGGTGTMADVTGISGEYTLPANGFTAPDGKQFKAWSVGGAEKAVGDKITVTANTTVTAVWETIPAGHTCDIKPVAKVDPSCAEGGKEAYYKCEGCGKFYEDALGAKEITDLAAWGNIAKNGHTESDWKTDKDNHWKECTVAACGVIIENSKAAHADANNDGKCDVCGFGESVNSNLQAFKDAVANLSPADSAEQKYAELSAALALYAKLTDAEKAEAAVSFASLQQAITAYNEKAQSANRSLADASELALAPIAASFGFLALLWFAFKKKFMM